MDLNDFRYSVRFLELHNSFNYYFMFLFSSLFIALLFLCYCSNVLDIFLPFVISHCAADSDFNKQELN